METNDKIAQRILKTVCEHFEQPIDSVISTSRKRKYIIPRQITMKLIREETTLSLEAIGALFTGEGRKHKDHATVHYALRTLHTLYNWKYGPFTIEDHIDILRHKIRAETAKQWPIQVRRYKYDYR